jgi:uncharacterized protein (UPF0179 family)
MGYQQDKQVDFNNLHFEWVRQVDLAHDYGVELAEASKAVNNAEEVVKVEEAKAANRVRESYAASGGKVTVDQVKFDTVLDPKYTEAREAIIKLRYELDLVKAAVKAIDDKKRALENAVVLFTREYWSTPVEQGDYDNWSNKRFTSENQKEVRKTATETMKEAATKRKRTT